MALKKNNQCVSKKLVGLWSNSHKRKTTWLQGESHCSTERKQNRARSQRNERPLHNTEGTTQHNGKSQMCALGELQKEF
jgi:hypothetical protein